MKTLIVTINTKYIHTSLAAWYLKNNCLSNCGEIKILEFTINDNINSILASIYKEKADNIAFSCYLWNIDIVINLSKTIKKLLKNVKIILGGPEVSFDGQDLLDKYNFIDYILSGEGEESLQDLLENLFIGARPDRKKYLEYSLIENLDSLKSPYSPEIINSLNDKIVYFESSRGCPFSCSYCLSSTFKGVRYFSLDRVYNDIDKLLEVGVKQIKFVDRTFNCNKDRAKKIFKYIMNKNPNTNFHFEVAADLFDKEILSIVSRAPAGLVQFEIGIQSTNPKTLEAVDRKTKIENVLYTIKKLISFENIHVHVDLIAGLPYEPYNVFMDSFNKVMAIKPHQLQLGFLKLLKGSKIRNEAEKYEYKFRDFSPYEFLENRYMSFDEVLLLKYIEEMVERYYNSGKFQNSLDYIIDQYFDTYFDFFKDLAAYCDRFGFLQRSLSSRSLYSVLVEFIETRVSKDELNIIKDFLKLDFLSSDNTNNLPEGIERVYENNFKEKCFEFLKIENNLQTFLPNYLGESPKKIYKRVHFEIFNYDIYSYKENRIISECKTVIVFNYSSKNKINELFEYKKISNIYF